MNQYDPTFDLKINVGHSSPQGACPGMGLDVKI